MTQQDVKNWLKHTPDAVQKKFKHGREGHFDRLPKVNCLTVKEGEVLHNPTAALPPFEFAVYSAFIANDLSLGYVEEACQRAAKAAPLRFREPGMAWVQAAKTAGAQAARMKELQALDPDVKERTEREVYEETRAAQIRQTSERLGAANGTCALAPSPELQAAFSGAWDALLYPKEPEVVHSYRFPPVATANVKTVGRFAAALKPGALIPMFTNGQHGQATSEATYQAAVAWGTLGAFDWEFRRQRVQAPDLRRATQLANSLALRYQGAGGEWYRLASKFLAAIPGVVVLQQEDSRLFDPDFATEEKAGFALAAMVSNDDAFATAVDWATRKAKEGTAA